ncbi:Yip1-domain-containing protein [Backusella circina FSU 941]|nr:Yip1-domain-containing protein [Backusella circina FSU 941]
MLSPSKTSGGHEELFENPFASENEDPFRVDTSSSSAYIEPDIDLTGQSTTRSSAPKQQQHENPFVPTGNIGQNASRETSTAAPQSTGSQYTGQDTLDEPVSVTIMRDLSKVAHKSLQVLHPKGDRNVLKDWDLWGPLLLCLTLAITLSLNAPDSQSVPIFTGVFTIVWLGAAVVTVNAKMLGGAVSFFQSVCVLGYCLFPLAASAIVATFVKLIWVRLPIAIVTFAWSTYASVGFMSESDIHLQNRRALAVYPLFLFYFIIAWLVLVS